VLAHAEAVEVEARRVLGDERAVVDELLKILAGLRVDLVGVDVRAVGQIDLGARDVEEAERAILRERARFLCVDHVVGDARHLLDFLFGRTQGAERMDDGHRQFSSQRYLGIALVWNALDYPHRRHFAKPRRLVRRSPE